MIFWVWMAFFAMAGVCLIVYFEMGRRLDDCIRAKRHAEYEADTLRQEVQHQLERRDNSAIVFLEKLTDLAESNDRLAKELQSRPDSPYGLPCWGEWIQKSTLDRKLDEGCVPVKVHGEWVLAMPIDEESVVSVLGSSLPSMEIQSCAGLSQ